MENSKASFSYFHINPVLHPMVIRMESGINMENSNTWPSHQRTKTAQFIEKVEFLQDFDMDVDQAYQACRGRF